MTKAGWKTGFLLSVAIGCSTAFASVAGAEITITRDDYGVPFIEGGTDAEMFFGYGYAMARDRIIQITKLKLLSSGIALKDRDQTVNTAKKAEEYVNYYLNEYPNLDAEIEKELVDLAAENSPESHRAILAMKCIAGGISQLQSDLVQLRTNENQIRNDCYEGPSDKSNGQFLSFKQSMSRSDRHTILSRLWENGVSLLQPWTSADVLKVFQNRVMDEFSNRNEEINSFSFLRLLEQANEGQKERAHRIFNSFKWVADPDAITEIPVAPLMERPQAQEYMAKYRNDMHGPFLSKKASDVCPVHASPEEFNKKASGSISKQMAHRRGFPQNASNFWAISGNYAAKGVQSVMFNGPQVGTLDPSGFYPFKMQSGEGFRYAGTSFAGTLTTFNGHNGKVASGFTAGNSDVSDVFCVDVEKMPQEDAYMGGGLKLVRNPDLLKRGIRSYYVEGLNWSVALLDTNQESNKAVAYIKRVAWQGTTALTFKSFLAASQASSIEEWNRALDTVGTNFNMVAVSREGGASIRLTGVIPPRVGSGQDNTVRLSNLYNSPDRYLWNRDIRLPVSALPQNGWHDGNPEFYKLHHDVQDGYVSSWNHKPYLLMPDSDLYYDSWYKWDRAEIINKALLSGRGNWDFQSVINLNTWLSRVDINFNRFQPVLKELETSGILNGSQAKVLAQILSWDGMRNSIQAKGQCSLDRSFVHSGAVYFDKWYEELGTQFSRVILKGASEDLKAVWNSRYAKLKQPKLNEVSGKQRLTYDTSQNVHIMGKIMLVNLMYAIGKNPHYDLNGWNILLDRAPKSDGSDIADTRKVALEFLALAIDKIGPAYEQRCPSLHAFATKSNRGVTMSSRTPELFVSPFRNRGAQNHAVEFSKNGVRGVNVVAPGVRELQGEDTRHTMDQLNLFDKDLYREMGTTLRSKL